MFTTLSYSKFDIIELQREESAEKSDESRKMLFILFVLRASTLQFTSR